jgi:hypothetical protein
VTEKYKWNKYDNMPTAYKEYELLLKSNPKPIPKLIKEKLNRFPYRYRLAKSFVGLDAKEVGKTLIGYEAGMKVFLAYTAYEDLIDAAVKLNVENVKKKYENEIPNKELALLLMKNTKMVEFVRENILDDGELLIAKMEDFIRGNSNDVLFLALAIRNFYAHGVFTATKGGVRNKSDKALYFKLANEVLKYCDKRFTNCVKILKAKYE